MPHLHGESAISSPRRTRGALGVLFVLVALYALGVGLRSRTSAGFPPELQLPLLAAVLILVAAVITTRPITSPRHRALWVVLAAAVVLRCVMMTAQVLFALRTQPIPYPSPIDGVWLLSSGGFLVALVLASRHRAQQRVLTMALDALLATLTVAAAMGTVFKADLIVAATEGLGPAAKVTTLLYPLPVTIALLLCAGLMGLWSWRPPRWIAALIVGVVGLSAVDPLIGRQLSLDALEPSTPLVAISLAAMSLVALAAWMPDEDDRPPPRGAAGLVVPSVLASLCVVLLFVGGSGTAPAFSRLMALGGLATAVIRAYVTVGIDRQEASRAVSAKQWELERFQALVEASSDFIALAGMDGSVRYLNPAGRELVGLPADVDVTTTTIADYLTEDRLQTSAEIEQLAVFEHGRWEGESTLRDLRGGQPIVVTANTFLIHHPETGEPWLLATVQRDITERLAAEQKALQLAAERQLLLGQLVEAQEAERARIASDVHDDSVQALAAVDLQLGLLQRRTANVNDELLPTIAELQQQVSHATARLRHLLFDLDSPAQHANLATALREAAATIFVGGPRWQVTAPDDADLPETQRVIAYRMVKEALANVSKHAGALAVEIDVRRVGEGVEVAVADDGIGFDPATVEKRPGHRGLFDLHDRAASAGGWVRLEHPEAGGTVVRIWLPSTRPA